MKRVLPSPRGYRTGYQLHLPCFAAADVGWGEVGFDSPCLVDGGFWVGGYGVLFAVLGYAFGYGVFELVDARISGGDSLPGACGREIVLSRNHFASCHVLQFKAGAFGSLAAGAGGFLIVW